MGLITNVLELGCGIGTVSAFLAQHYRMRVWGTDTDPLQIQRAQHQHPETAHLTFRVEDAAKLSFKDTDFDLVVSQNVFHHMAQWQTAASEISRVLTPGGYLLWLDLTCSSWIAQRFQPLAKQHGLYCISEATSVFRRQGFEQIFHKRRMHGLFSQHHIVWQKKG
ncbi:MAG: class I SAM-dependent methyltransferase [Deltaproteobacteria bacterium]|nr:class I SAM-dependent methyltransferase [Deltaproteobacteria bacterium]